MSTEPSESKAHSDLRERTEQFGQRIVTVYISLPRSNPVRVFADQLLRSGTSVGAHFAESCWAKSPADFISKIFGAMQELEESRYWIKMIVYADILEAERFHSLLGEISELLAIFGTMIRNTQSRLSA